MVRLIETWPARRGWWPDWQGETAVIAASGPSQSREDLEHVRGKARLIVVNRTWELAPWADVLYSGDPRFWRDYDTAGFEGLKVAGAKTDTVHTVPDDFGGVFDDVLAWLPKCARLHLSGSQAIVYAACWGARRIVLTGFDMLGGHWHGEHNSAPRSSYAENAEGLEMLAAELVGVEIVNCSRQTAVRRIPRARLEDVI